MKKGGFTLLEVLIYIALSCIFIILLFQFAAKMKFEINKIKKDSSEIIIIFNALEVIAKDIQKDPAKILNWILEEDKLYRTEESKNLVAQNVKKLEFKTNVLEYLKTQINDKEIKIVTIIIAGKISGKIIEFKKSVTPNKKIIE